MRRPAQICSFERRFASLGFLKAHMRRLWIGLIVLPDVLAVVNRTCNLAPRLHHGEGLCFRVLAQRLFGVEVLQCRNPISDAHAALLCQGRAIRPISPTRGAAGTLSRKSVRTVRRSLISDARKLWRSCWRRCRKVQRSLFRKVPSSWKPDIHSRSTIQSRSQQHLRKPRCGMRGDMSFG